MKAQTNWHVLAAAVLLCTSGLANASFVFTIERTSDTTATLLGSGSVDLFSDPTSIKLFDVFNSVPGSSISTIGTPTLAVAGAGTLSGVLIDGAGASIDLNFPGDFSAGSALTGAVTLSVSGGSTWKPVGSSGTGDGSGATSTTWEITDARVPEPSALLLFGAGLAGLVAARKRGKST